MDSNELRFKLDEHIDNLFSKAKEAKTGEELKSITEAIDAAYRIRPAEKSDFNPFPWLSLMLLNGGLGYFGSK